MLIPLVKNLYGLILATADKTEIATVEISTVLAIIGLILNAVLVLIIYLLNRKNKAEEQNRKTELNAIRKQLDGTAEQSGAALAGKASQLETAIASIQIRLDQLSSDNSSLSKAFNEKISKIEAKLSSDKSELGSLRSDVKDAIRRLETVYTEVMAHQQVCGDRYVQRVVYNEDTKAQREHLVLLREMIKQLSDVVEKLRN